MTNDQLQEPDFEDELCNRCGCCETYWEDCAYCGGEGGTDGEELMMEDPLWYSPEDFRTCDACNGKGGFMLCLGNCDENGKHNVPAACRSVAIFKNKC